ncbi:MAG: hypothetical protein ACI4JC_11080 [Faecalibacterium sp.]
MKFFRDHRLRRFVCALCALVCFLSAAFPVACAAGAEEMETTQTLTEDQALEMQQADQAVTALTESEAYAAMSRDERQDAALGQLADLVEQGLVRSDSVYADEENGMVSFTYTCGVLGGILLQDLDEDNSQVFALSQPDAEPVLENDGRYTELGSAIIYYAFDNTINSSRYPYYAYMQAFWTSVGLNTRLDANVTVSDLRRMDQYDLCMLGAHGVYYTYSYGIFWKRLRTEPLIILSERSTFAKDLRYGIDLLCRRVIKVNGMYCVTADFFRSAYRHGQLKDTIIFSETCEFYGVDGSIDTSIADALLAGRAKAVVGFVNNVYAVYSRSMMWDTVNQLIMGRTIQDALLHAMDTYGTDDLVWYYSQGGRRPHTAASYAMICGDPNAVLYEWEELALPVQAA